MKKLLALVVLALGLCATPALAMSLSFADLTNFAFNKSIALPDNAGYLYYRSFDPNASFEITEQGLSLTTQYGGMLYFSPTANSKDGITGVQSLTFSSPNGVSNFSFFENDHPGPGEGAKVSGDKNADGSWTADLSGMDSLGKIWIREQTYPMTIIFSSTTPTPVPAAVWLMGSGLAGLVALRRKMR